MTMTVLIQSNSLQSFHTEDQGRDYYRYLYRRKRSTWILALILALGMNIILFIIMSGLSKTAGSAPEFETLIPGVNIVRIKREDSPVKKITPRPPEPAEDTKPPEVLFSQTVNRNLSLPFDINMKLPTGSADLALPVIMNNLDFKNVFELDDLDQPLITLTRMQPVYPVSARKKGIQGWVQVRFLVNEHGRAEEPFVVDADPPGTFNESVINCLAGWRFKPGTVDGLPVKVLAETVIRFELE